MSLGAAFSIGTRAVGAGAPALIVGEVAQSHDGSPEQARRFIDAIAASGADAVKFQAHIAEAESTPREPWRVRFGARDATRYDYWKRMEWSEEQWRGLRQHAEQKGLLFLCSPFSPEAVELLSRVGMSAWKVASGEVSNRPLLERMAETGAPFLLSSGMSPLSEIDAAVELIQSRGRGLAVLQCTSIYPCPPEKLGLNLLAQLRERYGCPVGLSDHSGRLEPGLAAAALGCDVLEVHVALDRETPGPDVAVSLTPPELRALVDGVRFLERARANPVDKDALAAELLPMRQIFTKSIVARRALAAGSVLEASALALKKPGTGLPPERLPELLGRRLRRGLEQDEPLRLEDLEA